MRITAMFVSSFIVSLLGQADKKLMQYIAQSGNIQLLRYAIEFRDSADIYTNHVSHSSSR